MIKPYLWYCIDKIEELMKSGYPPINVKFTDRQKHYECFHVYAEESDKSNMILMVSKYIEEELDR